MSSLPPSFAAVAPRLALVGTGALGSELCRLLLESRHRSLLLIDPDALAEGNLPLSVLFSEAGRPAVGRLKTAVLAELAREQQLPWDALADEIADVPLGRLQAVDALVCCTDSALSRVEATRSARALGLPLYEAGVQPDGVPEGRVAYFAPDPAAACYLCGFSESRRAEVLAFALSASLGCTLPPDSDTRSMTGTSAALQATAAALLDLLAEPPADGSFAQRIRPGRPAEPIGLRPSPVCPWHSPRQPLQELPFDTPVSTLLAPGTVLELPWPLCVDARCRHCGRRAIPFRRSALVRRRLPCPFCGTAGALDPLRTLATIAAGDPFARQTLRELGLPAGQLYHLRLAMLSYKEPCSEHAE